MRATDDIRPDPRVKDSGIYLTDNGRALCGVHLGCSARYSFRDISGQEIMEVTPAIAKMSIAEGCGVISCETCGAQPGDAEVFAGHIARLATMSKAELDALVVAPPKIVRAKVVR